MKKNFADIYYRFTNGRFCMSRLKRCGSLATGRRARSRPRLELLEDRRLLALTITPIGTVTLDETAGLQNDDTITALPVAFSSRLTALGAPATEINHAVSTGNVISISGVTGTITNLAFRDTNGGVLDGDSSGLTTTDDEAISLFTDTVNDNIALGKTAAGVIAFAVYLEETGTPVSGGKFWTIQYEALKHPDATNPDDSIDLGNNLRVGASESISFSFANSPSGSNEFMMYGDNPAGVSTSGIVVTGRAPDPNTEDSDNSGDTVSASQAGPNTTLGTNGQHVAPGNAMYFTFVTNPAEDFTVAPNPDPHLPEGLNQTEADHEGNIQFGTYVGATEASVTIAQVNPTGSLVQVKISAFNNTDATEEGTTYVEGLGDADDLPVNITEVRINGVVVAADLTGDTALISGVKVGDVITYTTASAHNRVLIENAQPTSGSGSNITFDIGGFGFESPNSASAVVGTAVKFEDDGPTAVIVQGAATVAHDETAGVQADAKDTTDPAVAALFTGVTNVSTNLNPTGYAQNSTAVVSSTGSSLGTDSVGGTTVFSLGVSAAGVDSGLDTTNGTSIFLFKEGSLVVGRISSQAGAAAFAVAINGTSGVVSVAQYASLKHPDATNPDDSVSITDGALLAVVTVTDGDGDTATNSTGIGDAVQFQDDGPSITATTTGAPTLTVDESILTTNATASFAAQFSPSFGVDGQGATPVSYALSTAGGASGLTDTATGQSVVLSLVSGQVVGKTAVSGDTVFVVSVSASGQVTLDQQRAIVHANPNDPDESRGLSGSNLVVLTATATDGDADHASASLDLTPQLVFKDDGPSITAPFDADPSTGGIQTPEKLGNAVGQTASGVFGYDIGSDSRSAAFYAGGGSDFVDTNSSLAGVQIDLTGTVVNAQNPNITQAVATLTAETATSASFEFSFHYDKDPITPGVQDATAGGTLVFNKVADTYTFTLTDVIDGFSFNVLHTNELIAKQPTGNTGHPLIVAEQLTPNNAPNPFFVQFTGNSTTQQIGFGFNSTGDGTPTGPPTDVSFTQGAHDLVTNANEDWVSATQATNGVAGDTIQKGELLTLRFFQENILGDVNPNAPGGGTERLVPTTSASGVVIKFDGIGASEDLILILDLKAANGTQVTRAVNVQNSDLIKGNANIPFPYSTEFTLDNNDALLILEQNDYTVAGETYQIQGIQIMQSANGLTGNAINLNGATGTNGGSSATSSLTAWDPTDNDVLKIVDIGFVQQTSGTINSSLDFAFKIQDGDGDTTVTQHIPVDVSNSFIVGSALTAASLGDGAGTEALTEQRLQRIVAGAVESWQAVGLAPQQLSALGQVTFHVTDLPGAQLGWASGREIWIDADAAGWGWSSGAGSGRMDLAHAVEHELGHMLGFDHTTSGVMDAFLSPSTPLSPPSPAPVAVSAFGPSSVSAVTSGSDAARAGGPTTGAASVAAASQTVVRSGGSPGFLVVPFVAPSTQTLAAPSLSQAAAPLGASGRSSVLGALPAQSSPAPLTWQDRVSLVLAELSGARADLVDASLFDRLLEDGLVFPTSPLRPQDRVDQPATADQGGRGLVVPKDGSDQDRAVEPGTPLPTGEAAGASAAMIPACEAYLAEEDWTGWFTSRADEFARGMSECLSPSDPPGSSMAGLAAVLGVCLVSTQTREAAPHCAFGPGALEGRSTARAGQRRGTLSRWLARWFGR